MATTTQITTLDPDFGLTSYAGDYAADFDMDAVRADYLAALNEAVDHDVMVAANGMVFASVAMADTARQIDWDTLHDSIDVAAIFQRHDVSTTTEHPR